MAEPKQGGTIARPKVVEAELEIYGSGMYCVLPYEKLDEQGKAVFKIGKAGVSISRRIEQYTSYYPEGVWIVAALEDPTRGRDDYATTTTFYNMVETRLFRKVLELGGQRVTSTARVRNKKTIMGQQRGETEFFYTSPDVIHAAFKWAETEFGGEAHIYHLTGATTVYTARLKRRPQYKAELIFPLGNGLKFFV